LIGLDLSPVLIILIAAHLFLITHPFHIGVFGSLIRAIHFRRARVTGLRFKTCFNAIVLRLPYRLLAAFQILVPCHSRLTLGLLALRRSLLSRRFLTLQDFSRNQVKTLILNPRQRQRLGLLSLFLKTHLPRRLQHHLQQPLPR
jgi:hypothetical protein